MLFPVATQINFGVSISELTKLDFDGTLELKLNVDYSWYDFRLMWRLLSGIGNWTWPNSTIISSRDVYCPTFEVFILI